MHFLMIASQGSLARDSAVLKLSGKVFDKPFKGPVSLHTMHGHPILMKELLDAGLLHGDCLTVTGKTVAENLALMLSTGE